MERRTSQLAAVGPTQRILIGPLALEAAIRVIDAWDREEGSVREAGFSYITLHGHPECGVATFRVQVDETGGVTALIDTRSRPGTLLARIGRPMARMLQRVATEAALRRLTA